MGKIPNPFSLYDFLGYFIPGAAVVYSVSLLVGHLWSGLSVTDVYEDFLSFKDPGTILPFVLLSYIAGHIASYISSVTVEAYSKLQYGQPSIYLLGVEHKPHYWTLESRWDTLRSILGIFMLPVSLLDLALGRGLGLSRVYARGLGRYLETALRQKVEARLAAIGEPTGLDAADHFAPRAEFFLLLQHYAQEHCEHHRPKMDNYVALYGFLRTITLLFIVFAWVAVYHVYYVAPGNKLLYGTPLLLSLVAFVCYMAYMKFWRRYSLEVLMATAVTTEQP